MTCVGHYETIPPIYKRFIEKKKNEYALVENMARKNRNRFPIAVLLTTMLCNFIFVFLGLPADTLGILGLIMYRWKGLENTFPTIYHMTQNI